MLRVGPLCYRKWWQKGESAFLGIAALVFVGLTLLELAAQIESYINLPSPSRCNPLTANHSTPLPGKCIPLAWEAPLDFLSPRADPSSSPPLLSSFSAYTNLQPPTMSTTATEALVLSSLNAPFLLQPLTLSPPLANEVLLRITACGLCHTDLALQSGAFPTAFPSIAGHEGSGVVLSVGSEVKRVKEGDHVLLSFSSCQR